MTNRIGTRTLAFSRPPVIVSHATAVGKKENDGPLAGSFDVITQDTHLEQET